MPELLNPLAIYRSANLERRIPVIMAITKTDWNGRIFYQHQPGSWKRLRTADDYRDLNRIIDARTSITSALANR